jgi:hypothetical protein
MENLLSDKEAFEAMRIFLDAFYERGGRQDSLGYVLSAIGSFLWADGCPNDPAQWDDWLAAVKQVVEMRKGEK